MTDFDENGVAIAGTYAISTVSIGMWKADGTPSPTVDSAICDTCGGWASELWVAGQTTTAPESTLYQRNVSRKVQTIVYACPTHSEDISWALTEEFGACANRYDPDELAARVDESDRRRHRRHD